MPTAVADPRRRTRPAPGPGVLTKGMGVGRENGRIYNVLEFFSPGCQKGNGFTRFLKKKIWYGRIAQGILLFWRPENPNRPRPGPRGPGSQKAMNS